MSNISEHMLAKKYSKLADNLVNNTLLLFKKRRNKSTYKANQFIINHFYDPNKLTSINTTKHTSYIVPPLSRNTYLNSTKHQNITHKQQDHSYNNSLIKNNFSFKKSTTTLNRMNGGGSCIKNNSSINIFNNRTKHNNNNNNNNINTSKDVFMIKDNYNSKFLKMILDLATL